MIIFRFSATTAVMYALTAASVWPWIAPAAAQTNTRQLYDDYQLQALCSPKRSDRLAAMKRSECEGYILGVIDAHLLNSAGMGVSPIFCIPSTVSKFALTDIVRSYLVRSTERGTAASGAVLGAMMQAYPCQR